MTFLATENWTEVNLHWLHNHPWKCKEGKKSTITASLFTKTSWTWQFYPRCFPPLPWPWSGDRKILPAPGTNQIAGFSGYRPLTIKEINKWWLLKLKTEGQTIYRSFNSIKILLFPRLAQSGSEQPGPGASLLGWAKSIYHFFAKHRKSVDKMIHQKKNRGHQTSKIVKSRHSYSNGHLPYQFAYLLLIVRIDAWRGVWFCVRS